MDDRFLDPDMDSVVALLHREACHSIIERPGSLARLGVVLPAVPRAYESLSFDEPLSERSALVGASVGDRAPSIPGSRERKRKVACLNDGDAADSDRVDIGNH